MSHSDVKVVERQFERNDHIKWRSSNRSLITSVLASEFLEIRLWRNDDAALTEPVLGQPRALDQEAGGHAAGLNIREIEHRAQPLLFAHEAVRQLLYSAQFIRRQYARDRKEQDAVLGVV